jgi:phosphate transport system substrate-binding protein
MVSVRIVTVLCLFALCAASLVSQENGAVDQDVNLENYVPFTQSRFLARLDTKPSFVLDSRPRLDGATALYPVYAAFTEALYLPGKYGPHDPKSPVRCSKTAGAYERLIDGWVDIIFCGAPSGGQLAQAAERGVKLSFYPIGKDAFVFFVNRDNPVDGISSVQIRSIYSGVITNWQELNGTGEKIIAYQRPKNSGSQTMLENIMGDEQIMPAPSEYLEAGMGGMIKQIAGYKNHKNAIGYSFYFFATEMARDKRIKLLAVNGCLPSKQSIQDRSYPYTGTVYAITAGNESETVRRFIAWMRSGEGQTLVEKTGYVPLRPFDPKKNFF